MQDGKLFPVPIKDPVKRLEWSRAYELRRSRPKGYYKKRLSLLRKRYAKNPGFYKKRVRAYHLRSGRATKCKFDNCESFIEKAGQYCRLHSSMMRGDLVLYYRVVQEFANMKIGIRAVPSEFFLLMLLLKNAKRELFSGLQKSRQPNQ